VRLGFPPADAHHPKIMSHALATLERLVSERRALTKAAFASGVG
jgi:hypothetical protein